jgi:hypothetical protein
MFGSNIGGAVVAIIAGLVGLAIVAVVLSKNAQTPTIITNAGTALSGVIGAAVAPVSGGSTAVGG